MLKTPVTLATCAAVLVAAAALNAPERQALNALETRSVQVWLTPDVAGAERSALAVSAPGSPEFGRYLSPNEYTARFGPSAATARAVAGRLTAGGLADVQVSSGRDYVSAAGSPAKVRSVVATLDSRQYVGVTGLNTTPQSSSARTSRAAAQPVCSTYWAQHVQSLSPSYRGLTRASLPICGYSASQLRAAYGASMAFSGRGQTVALTEASFPTSMAKTLQEYAKRNGLPAPAPGQYQEQTVGQTCSGATTRSADRYDDEAEMDSEAVYAMAPHAKQLLVVGNGCDEDQGRLNAVLAVLTGNGHRPSATIISNSWQIPVGDFRPAVLHALTLRAALEGVGLYFSSGDTTGITATAQDPLVTAVGGTTMGLGATNERVFETGWSNSIASLDRGKWTDLGGGSAAGGGTSEDYPQPYYQKAVVPASMSHVKVGSRTLVNRAVPDVAAVADLETGMLVGHTAPDTGRYQTAVNAGTSLSAPLVAGLVAGAQQGRSKPFGFVNPVLYRLYGTKAFHDVLPVTPSMPDQNRASYTPATSTDSAGLTVFDAQDRTVTTQVTAKGYDTMTGVGTPNGLDFVLGLRAAR